MRELTDRSVRYLSGLKRVSVPSLADVRRNLMEQMPTAPQLWLDFHERFGGFVIQMGVDNAVLGLMHYKPVWLAPMECQIEVDEVEEDAFITCADVHPSYSFALAKSGEFLGGPAECFEIELERIALEIDFKMTMKSTKRYFNRESIPAQHNADIEFALKEGLVREASDGFQKMYRGSSVLLRIIEDSFEAWIAT